MENLFGAIDRAALITNAIVCEIWIFLLIGIIHILVKEYKTVAEIIKLSSQKKLTKDKFLQKIKIFRGYVKYIVEGLFFFFGGYIVIQTIDKLFNIIGNNNGLTPVLWNDIVTFSGVLGVIVFLVAGAGLIISAGNKWIVNTARILIILNILYLIVIVLAWQLA